MAKLQKEFTKKYKVTTGDNNNTIFFTNSLVKFIEGVEIPKYPENVKVELIK